MNRSFLHRRFIQPVLALLTQGVTPEKIALSLAFGVGLGVFPVLGSTTLLCAGAALIFRLNLPAIQLVNYFVYPLQLALIVPFMRAGEFLFHAPQSRLSLAQILAMVKADALHAISIFWVATLRAISVWLLVGPLLIAILYFVFSPLLRRVAVMAQARRESEAVLIP